MEMKNSSLQCRQFSDCICLTWLWKRKIKIFSTIFIDKDHSNSLMFKIFVCSYQCLKTVGDKLKLIKVFSISFRIPEWNNIYHMNRTIIFTAPYNFHYGYNLEDSQLLETFHNHATNTFFSSLGLCLFPLTVDYSKGKRHSPEKVNGLVTDKIF